MARFRSKVDTWLLLLLVIAIVVQVWALVAVLSTNQSAAVSGLTAAIIIPGILLTVSVLMRTNYTVAGGVLKIVSGPFRWSIPIVDITEVVDSRSPISSPALSLDRLRISYGLNKQVLVSPDDKAGFLRAIEQQAT
jgi:hypothetical protein